jgi:nucleotide-binding universal stress UspA family protein
MGKYRKILIAIDGSASSMHALGEAFKLAENERSWMTVVSVIPPYLGDLDMTAVGNVLDSIRKPCEKAIEEARAMAGKAKVMVRAACEEGEPHERIVDLAAAENFDLIVMGRRGRGRLDRALMGSVAARVIGYAMNDILVVPESASVGWKRILVATDGSKQSGAAVSHAINLAGSYGGELIFLSVVDVNDELYGEAPGLFEELVRKAKLYVENAAEQAEKEGIPSSALVREAEVYRSIVDLAEEKNINTIIMGSHGRTGLKRLLMGSVTERVIGYAKCPVLVVKG